MGAHHAASPCHREVLAYEILSVRLIIKKREARKPPSFYPGLFRVRPRRQTYRKRSSFCLLSLEMLLYRHANGLAKYVGHFLQRVIEINSLQATSCRTSSRTNFVRRTLGKALSESISITRPLSGDLASAARRGRWLRLGDGGRSRLQGGGSGQRNDHRLRFLTATEVDGLPVADVV